MLGSIVLTIDMPRVIYLLILVVVGLIVVGIGLTLIVVGLVFIGLGLTLIGVDLTLTGVGLTLTGFDLGIESLGVTWLGIQVDRGIPPNPDFCNLISSLISLDNISSPKIFF